MKKGLNVSVFAEGRTPLNSRFENNIFFFEERGRWGSNSEGINTIFRNNIYFNIEPHNSDSNPMTIDPKFLQAGQAKKNIDLKTMEALDGYYRRLDSTLFSNDGVEIINNGGQNLLKVKVKSGRQGIGAF